MDASVRDGLAVTTEDDKKMDLSPGSICRANAVIPWRPLWRFFTAVIITGFILNEIWEMAQMSAYVETAGHSWASTLGMCTMAALGDVGIILGIYVAGALVAADPGWGLRGRWKIYILTAVLGLAYAALVEQAALATGRWSYTGSMPVVPVLGAGLWPLLQMTLLPPITFLFARWMTGRKLRPVHKSTEHI